MPRGLRNDLKVRVLVTRRALLAVAAVGVLVGCAQSAAEEHTAAQPVVQQGVSESADTDRSSPEASSPAPVEDAATSAAEPEGVQIPSIDVDEDQMVDLEIMGDGRLEEPSGWNDVGWFSGGPRPGEAGATVIAAHVDSPTGPAVFYRLLEVERGEEVTVVDAGGRAHLYQVERTADFPKDDFPTRQVFGAQPEDELRLITCTGEFEDATQRHLDNRVVFASRVG